ncbi:hypothetical protein EYF80_003368 [Liparis tanakae]|uniref:Uncharacterized protein n=1 Tax=Liparis tanakae TaxID=230148 RepID=A0A4Z2J9C3_9TELE|nr:hypothetical protein EYF80_003368 [Liparis tanakae]
MWLYKTHSLPSVHGFEPKLHFRRLALGGAALEQSTSSEPSWQSGRPSQTRLLEMQRRRSLQRKRSCARTVDLVGAIVAVRASVTDQIPGDAATPVFTAEYTALSPSCTSGRLLQLQEELRSDSRPHRSHRGSQGVRHRPDPWRRSYAGLYSVIHGFEPKLHFRRLALGGAALGQSTSSEPSWQSGRPSQTRLLETQLRRSNVLTGPFRVPEQTTGPDVEGDVSPDASCRQVQQLFGLASHHAHGEDFVFLQPEDVTPQPVHDCSTVTLSP